MANLDCSTESLTPSTGDGLGAESLPAGDSRRAGTAPDPAIPQPPLTDRGVEFCLHWLAVTFWSNPFDVADWFCHLLGKEGGLRLFERLPHGARGFEDLFIGPGGAKLYAAPRSGEGYCHLEIPGELVRAISPECMRKNFSGLTCRYQVTRLDLAFDTDALKPSQVFDAVLNGDVRSLAKRQTLKELREPLRGSHTVYFGSRQSERMLRVYLKDGRTRVELECKDKRADAILRDLINRDVSQWAIRAMAHLRDFADFKAAWWEKFCQGVERAKMVLAKVAWSFERTQKWLQSQVASSLALLEDVLGFSEVVKLLDEGRKRYRSRHRVVLARNLAGV